MIVIIKDTVNSMNIRHKKYFYAEQEKAASHVEPINMAKPVVLPMLEVKEEKQVESKVVSAEKSQVDDTGLKVLEEVEEKKTASYKKKTK